VIGSLTGVLAEKAPPRLLLDVGGVGYDLEAPMSTCFALPAVGERARVLTHMVVREDALLLYAFATEAERSLFRNLLKVSGVGPRIALALLSGISIEDFVIVVRSQDVAALTRVPGIGRKIAERLLVEMRDRMDETATLASAVPVGSGAEADALNALLSLGYKPAEATRLIKAVGDEVLSTEDLIRRALQGAAKA
jgi:holliday junction DNA helicase RuvA